MKVITKPIGFLFGLLVGLFLVSALSLVGIVLLVVKWLGVDTTPFFDAVTEFFSVLRGFISS